MSERYSMGPRGLGYVRRYYGVPAKRGLQVIAEGYGPGVITCGAGAHIRVRLDGWKRSALFHPLSLDYCDGISPADRLRERNEAIARFNAALNRINDRKERR